MSALKNRSVVDFDTEEALRKALMSFNLPTEEGEACTKYVEGNADTNGSIRSPIAPQPGPLGESGEPLANPENMDWALPSYDPDTTEVQSMKEELHRLQVLKSYLILDAEREESFERITALACRIFNVPIALVSLVDLGRQWFMSNRGLGSVRETPRKYAFCAHAILNKHNLLVVPDASKDFRFETNPLVTGPPNIRFYAGSPLVSPEGYKLGTLCIIDSKVRPEGLLDAEKATLRDLADMVVKEMVDRRFKMKNQQSPARMIAYTAHDLLTPLTGVQLSLSLLKDDEQVQSRLGPQQLELLNTASNCSDWMIRICRTAMETLRQESTTPELSITSASTKITELTKSLLMIMEPIPKRIPFVITVDPKVPPVIICDDLKLFRSALNLISSAIARTIWGKVHFRIHVVGENNDHILFECEDTASDIDVQEYPYLFQPSRSEDGQLRLCLNSVAILINSLDGTYGFRPRGVAADGSMLGGRHAGSIFWFSVPLQQQPNDMNSKGSNLTSTNTGQLSILHNSTSNTSLGKPKLGSSRSGPLKMPIIPVIHKNGSSTSVSSFDKISTLKNLDVFTPQNMRNSCFSPSIEDGIFPSSRSTIENSAVSKAFAHVLNGEDRKMPPIGLRSPMEIRKRQALVIEDSLVVRKSLAQAFERLGFVVTQAVDGLEGLNALKETIFDVTLCDFLMPVMDGMDCVKQYRDWERENRPWFRQLIIGISAHANANDSGQGIKVGMDQFWPKPVSIKKLMELQESDVAVAASRELDRQADQLDGGNCNYSNRNSFPFAANIVDSDPLEDTAKSIPKKRAAELETKRTKRPKFDLEEKGAASVGLIATSIDEPSNILAKLESQGWTTSVVHDSDATLQALKLRNYSLVLIEDMTPNMDACACMTQFRTWEEENRVNRQKNTYFISEASIPSPFEANSFVQPPSVFDGVLRKPVVWEELEFLRQKKDDENCRMEIVIR
jgi:CheY-like chemotaxis protein